LSVDEKHFRLIVGRVEYRSDRGGWRQSKRVFTTYRFGVKRRLGPM
jgi:hypothetical protein